MHARVRYMHACVSEISATHSIATLPGRAAGAAAAFLGSAPSFLAKS